MLCTILLLLTQPRRFSGEIFGDGGADCGESAGPPGEVRGTMRRPGLLHTFGVPVDRARGPRVAPARLRRGADPRLRCVTASQYSLGRPTGRCVVGGLGWRRFPSGYGVETQRGRGSLGRNQNHRKKLRISVTSNKDDVLLSGSQEARNRGEASYFAAGSIVPLL